MSPASSGQGSTQTPILNGSASQRLFERIAQLDETLSILLVLQLLLLHCYVPLRLLSSKWM
jgi:hypothetical protein